jgi:hypothetical protein
MEKKNLKIDLLRVTGFMRRFWYGLLMWKENYFNNSDTDGDDCRLIGRRIFSLGREYFKDKKLGTEGMFNLNRPGKYLLLFY